MPHLVYIALFEKCVTNPRTDFSMILSHFHLNSAFKKSVMDRQTDGQTDGRTDGWTDGRTNGRTDRFSFRDAHLKSFFTIIYVISIVIIIVIGSSLLASSLS